jgi:hypothetical protein
LKANGLTVREGQTIKLSDGCSRMLRMATFKEGMIHNGLAEDRLEQIHPSKIAGGLCY